MKKREIKQIPVSSKYKRVDTRKIELRLDKLRFSIIDVTNRESFENLDQWVNSFTNVASRNACTEGTIMILPNKCNLEGRVVSQKEGLPSLRHKRENWAEHCRGNHRKQSAKDTNTPLSLLSFV